MNITINRIPGKVAKEIKALNKSASGYCRTALAEKLTRDGKTDAAQLLSPKK